MTHKIEIEDFMAEPIATLMASSSADEKRLHSWVLIKPSELCRLRFRVITHGDKHFFSSIKEAIEFYNSV